MLQGIYISALNFLSPQTLEETYKTAVREATKITQSDYGTLYLRLNGELTRVYTNFPKFKTLVPRKTGFTQKSFETKKSYVIASSKLAKTHPDLLEKGIKSLIIIPLIHHKKSIGVLSLQAKNTKHFTKERIDALRVFGSLLSLAIEKNRLYLDMQNALKTRDLFISMAAHELRTPTTTIQGYTQMMIKKYAKGEKLPLKWIEILNSETIRLNNLLKELLQIEQIKTGQFKYTWKKNSLLEIIDRVLAYSKVSHPHHKVIFKNMLKGRDHMYYCDFDKIMQVLIILVNNSAKFSKNHSTIEVGLSDKDSFFNLWVKDYGSGITKDDLSHIFEGFYKGKDNSKDGFGLGLFLAENIVRRHYGTIFATSSPGRGTKIEMKLPIFKK